jgi:uncharacterized protein (DUF924 family)
MRCGILEARTAARNRGVRFGYRRCPACTVKETSFMSAADAQAVLDFWFGAPRSATHGQWRDAWFRKDAAFDAAIAQRFGAVVETALAGGLRDWTAAPGTTLARIVLLDQFTRNVFRDRPRAFAGDALALEAAQAMVAAGHDRALDPVQRAFVYLPFEHAESLAMQDESVRLFAALADETPSLRHMLAYAHRHRDVIVRFGRFAHRNAVLDRRSTAEELAFLSEAGARF